MNIEEIKMDHFENFEELIKTCKMWIRDDDIDAYYRFFEFNCMKALLTAYEKEKEKNKNLEQENSFLKMMYRGTDEFKAIENLAKEE